MAGVTRRERWPFCSISGNWVATVWHMSDRTRGWARYLQLGSKWAWQHDSTLRVFYTQALNQSWRLEIGLMKANECVPSDKDEDLTVLQWTTWQHVVTFSKLFHCTSGLIFSKIPHWPKWHGGWSGRLENSFLTRMLTLKNIYIKTRMGFYFFSPLSRVTCSTWRLPQLSSNQIPLGIQF